MQFGNFVGIRASVKTHRIGRSTRDEILILCACQSGCVKYRVSASAIDKRLSLMQIRVIARVIAPNVSRVKGTCSEVLSNMKAMIMTPKNDANVPNQEGLHPLSSSHRNTVRTLSNAVPGQTHRSKQRPLNTIIRRRLHRPHPSRGMTCNLP
jgi:hypothetical protein